MDDTQGEAIQRVVSSPLFPFDEQLKLKPVGELLPYEIIREGEGDRPCKSCGDESRVLWQNDRWKITPLRPTANPAALFLETVEHIDFDDFDAAMAGEFGVLTWQIERAMAGLDAVGRVHVHRYGDGSAHFHVWFQGRPARQLELYGWGNVLWSQVLPPLPADEIAANHAHVISCVSNALGGSLGLGEGCSS